MPSEDSHQLIRRAESYVTRDDLRASSRFLFFWGPTLTSLEIESVQSHRRDPGLSLSRLPTPWIVSLRTAFLLFRFHHTIADRAVSVSP